MVIDEMIPYVDYLGVSGGSSGGGSGEGLTSEQAQQLQTAYEHSQSDHVTMDEVNVAISNAQLGGGIDTSTFQLKTDESLETTDKTVVGAINELNNDLGGKSFIYLTQAEFDALESKNENVVYGITDYIETTSPSIDDIAAEISKISLNINGSILSLIYNETTLSTITLPTSSGGGTEVTETFGNIVLSKTVDSVTEGNTTTFTVKLDAAPTNSQVVNLSADNLYVTLDKDSLTFTAADYSTPQTVKVNAMSVDSTQISTITVSSPNISSKTLVITVNDSTPSSGGGETTNTLTRDGLVYYLDFKDQNYTAGSVSAYKTISDTNTLYSEELLIQNINNTNNNFEGNVIEGNVLKSGELSIKKYPRINNIDRLVTDIFTNGSFTFETYAQFNAKPVDNSTILFNTGTLLFRGNIGNDIGLYITTESNGSYGYFNFDSTSIDYTQPHLYTVTIDQSISGSITYSMYVDGELNQNGTKTGTIKTVATPYLHIIEDNDRNKEYASFRVYNKVLTADEVLANYQYEQTIERTW